MRPVYFGCEPGRQGDKPPHYRLSYFAVRIARPSVSRLRRFLRGSARWEGRHPDTVFLHGREARMRIAYAGAGKTFCRCRASLA
jgi:hypothetical protein